MRYQQNKLHAQTNRCATEKGMKKKRADARSTDGHVCVGKLSTVQHNAKSRGLVTLHGQSSLCSNVWSGIGVTVQNLWSCWLAARAHRKLTAHLRSLRSVGSRVGGMQAVKILNIASLGPSHSSSCAYVHRAVSERAIS